MRGGMVGQGARGDVVAESVERCCGWGVGPSLSVVLLGHSHML